MYRFERSGGPRSRLFLSGTRQEEDNDRFSSSGTFGKRSEEHHDDANVHQVLTHRRLTTETNASGEDSTRVERKGKIKSFTTRVVKKTTTVTRGDQKMVAEAIMKTSDTHEDNINDVSNQRGWRTSQQPIKRAKMQAISDIVIGKTDNLSAREALLRWAKRTTHRYPDVRVTNFTTSWRDGLAMVAIIHRNSEIIRGRQGQRVDGKQQDQPDLVDWRGLRQRSPRDRLETAFHVMEREYGVTRLLDPEDVDTPEPDEKSLITYISQLYEIFPEPPSLHPLFSAEAQRKLEEYQELAAALLHWIQENITLMRDRKFPSNTIELKRLAQDSTRFRQDEVPPKLKQKNRCQSLFRDIQRLLDGTGFIEDIPQDLHYPRIDSEWNRLMSLFQERDDALHDHLSGADRLQRLAEKINRDIKHTDLTLEEVEIRIEEEARRVDRLHPLDAKRNCDAIDNDLGQCEDTIRNLHGDVKVLRDNKYHEAPTLHKRVVKLEERYVSVRTLFENRLLIVLNNKSFTQQESFTTTKRIVVSESRLVDTNEHFKFLQECINWCKDKLRKLNDSDYGNDLAAVEREYENHQREHKIIHQFHTNVDQCAAAEHNFTGEERQVYVGLLSQLRKTYAELLSSSNKRVSDLFSLLEFLQAATQELIWLNEKEETELNRDWANKSLNISEVERYHEKLMNELEKRESQFSSVQDKGNNLVLSHHPASKTVEAYLAAMQTQWQWLLELTLCLETHLHHASYYHTFFTDVAKAEQWIMTQDERLNTTYSVTDFGLDDGEQLLREMQDVREELAQFNSTVDELINRSKSVVPLKQRRQSLRQPTHVNAICSYKKMDVNINKGERCVLHDNSNRSKWRVNASGLESLVPGVIFTIPPPNNEAIEAAEKLKRQYERGIALWQKKQLRLRQNMIFATIKVVKSWDLAQFIAMGPEQRNAIRRALNEDAEKLIQEGDPNDPQLRRLKREIDEVNRLFDEFERRANEPKPGQVLVDQSNNLKEYLDMMEKLLIQRSLAAIPRDLDLLERLVIEHKQFENDLSSRELEVESIQKNYNSLTRRTPVIQRAVEAVTQQWDRIWALSHVYIERMKCVEMVVTGIEEGTQVISDVEMKLAEYQDLPDDMDLLEHTHNQLLQIQNIIQDHQILVDRLIEECRNVRTLVVKSRPSQIMHPDVDKLEEDVRKLRMRWDNICTQIIERLRSCEAASELLAKYRNGLEEDATQKYIEEVRAAPIEDLGPTEAELEAERLRKMYLKVIEKKPSVEKINILGARFIREAKIYDLRLSQYKASLEEVHPSLDASVKRLKTPPSGAANVTKELDLLNQNYRFLADEIYDRIAKLCNKHLGSKKFNFDMSDLSPINLDKTFRNELNFPLEEDVEHGSVDQVDTNGHKSEASIIVTDSLLSKNGSASQLLQGKSETNGVMSGSSFVVTSTVSSSHSNYARIIDPISGKQLSIGEAVAAGLLNLVLGTFRDPNSNREVKLEDAVNGGLLSPDVAQQLNSPCGVIDPTSGKELTLLEAAKLGLYDPEKGAFIDPNSGRQVTPEEAAKLGFILKDKVSVAKLLSVPLPTLTLYEAVVSGLIDPRTGNFKLPDSSSVIPLQEAFALDLISTHSNIHPDSHALALSDAISQGLVDPSSGQVVDKFSGSLHSIDEAVAKGLISGDKLEVVDPKSSFKLTVKQAVENDIIDTQKGKYKDLQSDLSLSEAFEKKLIYRPLSIKDAYDLNILSDEGQVLNPVSNESLFLLDAIGKGVLDVELKSIQNTKENCALTLPQAFKESVILVQGQFCDTKNQTLMSLPEAVNKGFITSVRYRTIFDIEGIKDSRTGDFITFKEASNIGIIKSGMFYDPLSEEPISFDEAVKRNLMQVQILESLRLNIGVKDLQGNEMSAIEAVSQGYLNPFTGSLLDPTTSDPIPTEIALQKGLISAQGAGTLKGLLNVVLTTSTITKTSKRIINVDDTDLLTSETTLSYEESQLDNLFTLMSEKSQEDSDVKESSFRPDSIFSEHETHDRDTMTSKDESPSGPITSSMKSSGFGPESPLKTDEGLTPLSSEDNFIGKEKAIKSPEGSIDSAMEVVDGDMTSSTTSASGTSTRIYDIPDDGWFLKEAIEQKLFDPISGLFVVPGTDRLVSFQECINMCIINVNSADVIDPVNERVLTISRAFDKQILDSFGKYKKDKKTGMKIVMKEAIEEGFIILKNRTDGQRKDSFRSLCVTSVEGQPVKIQIAEEGEGILQQRIKEVPTLPLNPSSEEILKQAKENPMSLKIQDPNSNEILSFDQAVERGIVSTNSQEFKDKSGKKFSLATAFKMGAIGVASVAGAPVIAGYLAAKAIQKRIKERDPVTGTELIIEEQSSSTIKHGLDRSSIDPLSSSTKKCYVVDQTTGSKVSLDDAVQRGLVSEEFGNKIQDSMDDISFDPSHNVEVEFKTLDDVNVEVETSVSTITEYLVTNSTDEDQDSKQKVLTDNESPVIHDKSSFIEKNKEVNAVAVLDDKATSPINSEKQDIITDYRSISYATEKEDKINPMKSFKSHKIDSINSTGPNDTLSEKPEQNLNEADSADNNSNSPNPKIVPTTDTSHSMVDPDNFKSTNLPITDPHLVLKDSKNVSNDDKSEISLGSESEPTDFSTPSNIPDSKRVFDKHGKEDNIKSKSSSSDIVIDNGSSRSPEIKENPSVEVLNKDKNRDVCDNIASSMIPEEPPKAEITFRNAIEQGLIDIENGTFNDSGLQIPIQEAIEKELISTPKHILEPTANQKLDITEAVNSLLDQTSGKFVNPLTNEKLTFADAVKEGIIDEESIIYDTNSKHTMSVGDALSKGILDSKSGDIIDPKSQSKTKLKDAVKKGLLAVIGAPLAIVGAPILAGMAVKEHLKNKKTDRTVKDKTNDPKSEQISNDAFPLKTKKSEIVLSPANLLSQISPPKVEQVRLPVQGPAKSISPIEVDHSNVHESIPELPISTINEKSSVIENIDAFPDEESIAIENKHVDHSNDSKIKGSNVIETNDSSLLPSSTECPTANLNTDLVDSKENISAILHDIDSEVDLLEKSVKEESIDESVNIDSENVLKPTFNKESLTRENLDEKLKQTKENLKLDFGNQESHESKNKNLSVDSATEKPRLMGGNFDDESFIEEPKKLEIQSINEDSPIDDLNPKIIDSAKKSTGTEKEIDSTTTSKIEIPPEFKNKQLINDSPINSISKEPTVAKETIAASEISTQSISEPSGSNIIDAQTTEVEEGDFSVDKEPSLSPKGNNDSSESSSTPEDSTSKDASVVSVIEQPLGNLSIDTTASIQKNLLSEYDPKETVDSPLVESKTELIEKVTPISHIDQEDKKDEVLDFRDAVLNGRIDLENGTFVGQDDTKIPIQQAIADGKLIPHAANEEYLELGEKLSIANAASLYNESEGKYEDPITKELLTFEEALNKGVIDQDSLIYDIQSKQTLSAKEALSKGILDPKSGDIIDVKSGSKTKMKEAVKKGLLAVIGAPLAVIASPILAGMAVKAHLDSKKELKPFRDQPCVNFPGDQLMQRENIDKSIDTIGNALLSKDITFKEALDQKLIDPKTTMILDSSGTETSLDEKITSGSFDPSTGMLLSSEKQIPFASLINQGLVKCDDKDNESELRDKMSLLKGDTVVDVDPQLEDSLDESKDNNIQDITNLQKAETIAKSLLDPTDVVSILPEQINSLNVNTQLVHNDLQTTSPETDNLESTKDIAMKNSNANLANESPDDGLEAHLKDQDTIPVSFEYAIESGLIDSQTGLYSSSNRGPISLYDACLQNLIDPNSAYIKNTRKKELLNLTDSFSNGVIDRNTSQIFDTSACQQLSIKNAISSSLVVMPSPSLSVFEVLLYKLYNPATKQILEPFQSKNLSFGDSIECKLVDPTSALVKCPATGTIFSIQEALSSQLMNPETGDIRDAKDGTLYPLLEAKAQGYLFPPDTRMAMIQKYKDCDAAVADLLEGISEVERRLAEQQPVSENQQGLRNQINTLKLIKETLDEMFRPLGASLDNVRNVVDQGSIALSRMELDTLDAAATNLKSRYDKCVEQADNTHRRLTTASEELSKYEKEIELFQVWLKQSGKTLIEKERLCAEFTKGKGFEQSCRDFLGDVIAHQADLRFITMAVQKFYDESADHLRLVNAFRTSLPDRYSVLHPNPNSDIKEAVDEVTAEFKDLLARATRLVDRVTGVGNKQRDYTEAIEKAMRWLKEMETKTTRILQESIAGDTRSIQDQLDKTKSINNEILSNGRLFENCRSAASALVRSLDGELDAREQQAIEQPPEDLAERYAEVANRIGQRCQELDSALVQSQGVQEGLDSLMNWLNNADLQLKNASKPASLIRERLDEQIKEHRQIHADIMSHQASVVRINDSAAAIMQNASNAKIAKKIETKLKELNTKYEKMIEKSDGRGHHLEQVSVQLDAFTQSVDHFEEWYIEIIEVIESKEVLALDTTTYQRKINEITKQRDARSNDFNGMLHTGKDLVSKKDVTDTALVKDKIKNLEGQWKDLNDTLDDRARAGKERSEQQMTYDHLRDKIMQWLTVTETTIERFQPVALDQNYLKKQFDDLKPLLKEYKDYANTVDKVNELGAIYDSLLRGERTDSIRRRSSVTPVKRPSLTSPLKSSVRRVSQDVRSPSPSGKLFNFNGTGSLSRRTSTESYYQDEMSTVQKELLEINSRYEMIGMRLAERQNDLDLMHDELKKLSDIMKGISIALDKAARNVPKDTIPTTKEEADKFNKQTKNVLDDLSEKQPALDNLKTLVIDLIKKKPNAPGAENLMDQLEDLVAKFKDLQGILKNKLNFLDGIKEFLDNHDALNTWLSSKDKMMAVLGPIASDPRMAQMQAQQINVLRDEFHNQEPKMNNLNDTGDKIIGACEPNSLVARKINDKLDAINNKWAELIGQLDARDTALDAASDASKEFYNNYNKLNDKLQKLGDDFDDSMAGGIDSGQQLQMMQALENGLEGLRQPLINLEGLGEHLMSILSDPSSKSDIKSKIGQLTRMFNNLERKLNNKKSELEASLKDQEEFGNSCHQIQDWLADQIAQLKDQLLVSADKDVLDRQVADFEPVYKDLMGKEHEVIMMINKGKELVLKSPRKDTSKNLSATLDAIKIEWDKVRKVAVDRRSRLQKCHDTCNKFHSMLNKFIPWIEKVDGKARNFDSIAFNKRAIEKQIKEIQEFKNDISRRSGDYENNRAAGEALIACTDVDHDGVKDLLEYMKERWDQLNSLVMSRAQDLDDVAQKLNEFNDKSREANHALQRCEDRLSSQENIGGNKDAKSLDRIKALLEETNALANQVDQVGNKGEDLISAAQETNSDASHIEDEVNKLLGRFGDLKKKLESKCHDLEDAANAVNQFAALVKNVGQELSGLDDELDRMSPVGRDIKTVTSQIEQLHDYINKVDSKSAEINDAKSALKELVKEGFTTNNRVAEDQIKQLSRQLKKIQDRCDSRGKDLTTTLKKLEDFYDKYEAVMDDIREADREGDSFKPVGADVDTIKSQQDEFRRFKTKKIEALGKLVSDINKKGQGLIQSASSGVNTSGLEKDLEALNNLWNNLKQLIGDREKALDKGLMQSGKFQEALDSMSQWLGNFEEMMDNQAPISGDYSVVKAQAQEQKFLRKMLLDRQNEMKALLDMGKNLASNLDPSEKANVEGQLDDLLNRFDDANGRSQERMEALDETLKVAKEFQNKLNPILVWLDRTDKKLKDMSIVPSDEDKISRLIKEHDKLHDDILGQKPAFDDLTDVATALMSLIGDEEAISLADKLQSTTDRYGQLVEDSEALGRLLEESKAGLRHLVLTYEDLLSWMDEMDARLSKYRILSVFVEKLLEQMDELTDLGEEVVSQEKQVHEVMEAGNQLMKHISSDEAIQLKEKLDSIQRRYSDLSAKATDLHKSANEALPLVQQFHNAHERLGSWMLAVEGQLQSMDSSGQGLVEEEIERLGKEIQVNRPLVEAVNLVGPQLCQISPGEGASNIETLVTRDNRRFEQICEQIQRRLERVQMSKQRSKEVTQDIDELLDWFREVENQIKDAEPPSVEPDEIRIQLKEHKALNDDVASQKGRVRDVLANSKRVLRETPTHEDTSELREKMDDLKETMESVSKLSSDRLSNLEQALPLAEHFFDTHHELDVWLSAMENEAMVMDVPALRPDQIMRQMERNKGFLQSISDHKPLLDKLNKTGGALLKLINDEDGSKIQDILELDNARFNSLKSGLRERGQALEDALQETSQFADKLDGMLSALSETADQVKNAEPISAHPEKIVEQVQENNSIIDDLDRKESAFKAVKAAAEDVINKASRNDPAVRDIKGKLDRLNKLWNNVVEATKHRGRSLDDALALAEKFWDELQGVMTSLKDLQDALKAQEPVAVEPNIIKQQRDELNELKDKIDQTKPEVEQVRKTGKDLMNICGDQDKPDVNKNIEDLDYAWDTVTALYAKREENLIDAMEKAMEFHDTLRNMLEFLEKAENKFEGLGAIAGDIEAIKKQINQLHRFKDEVDPHMVKVEALNRQAQELKERTSPDQAAAIMKPLGEVNRRWDNLMKGIVDRQRDLEYALLKLGQFQHALSELLVWIERTDRTLDDLKPVFGDPQVIEVELAKLKVQINDIKAHQSSVDTLNDAGRQLIEADKGSEDASITQKKLLELNKKWDDLQSKAISKQTDLENALREAQIFNAEVQDLLLWLTDIDQALSSSKPVAGLPETAREQLLRFMEMYDELEENRSKVTGTLQQGQEYIKKSRPGSATNLNHDLRTLKQRWESVLNKANDKKIKLEIALKEATEFHDALQGFVDWLTEAENFLNGQQPVSRILDVILQQIEEHNHFKKDVTAHRETMVNLEKKGTHLKYFTQKQDVILIKNLLVSVQHRWEKVVHKAADRTRQLDLGFKEAKEFHEAWNELMTWLEESESTLDELADTVGNDPERIKMQIQKHKEFQKALGSKQPFYDHTMKSGKNLQSKAPKTDEATLKQMLYDLKNKWNNVCQKSVDRQRKLEEALLFTGQFKDAIQALLDWLKKVEVGLVKDGPVHGDLDTVLALVEQHKSFCVELKNRYSQVESVRRTAEDLLVKASPEDAANIRSQVSQLVDSWDKVENATEARSIALEEALQAAEKLHKVVHMLLDWLSDAEMKLRYAGQLPEDEEETRKQIAEHEMFLRELKQKEIEKDETIALAEEILAKAHPDGIATIKHWITIIQSRWEEVTSWASQRAQRLDDHLKGLEDLLGLLDELMRWLIEAEGNLITLEAEPLPDEIPLIEGLIEDHKQFMDEMQKKEPEVLSICKPLKARPSISQPGKRKSRTSIGRESLSPRRDFSPDRETMSRKSSRMTPDREMSPGTSRKSSRASPAREITPTREYPRPWMYGARTTPPREVSPGGTERPSREWPLYNMRFAPTPSRKGSKTSAIGGMRPEEIHIKNPRARALWEKWQQVGFMAWERMRKLIDKLNHLKELEKLKNFSWEEWRKRFMKFMNNKKSRVTDLFRKMDTDNDGAVPRLDFIDGIIKTKYPTSKLEMGTVADIFDRNHDGFIDYQEFIAALRPDWERKAPETDAERIDDEVQRQVDLCTCRQKFRVHQVGEGKYRFGDNQKLRLVRILRSTVMVRVGGGWVALDEFLVKNDPCRVCPSIPELELAFEREQHEYGCPMRTAGSRSSDAGSSKGRTNVELREQFILAEGVSQSMTPFKSKPSPNSSVSSQSGAQQRSQSLTSSGPIIKVRERTSKSVAMGRPTGGSSYNAGTPDSTYNDDPSSFRLHDGTRKRLSTDSRGGSRPSSRGPGSRPGSRPMSRTGSEVSLDSYDGKPGMRRTPSFTGRKTPSSQTSNVQRTSSLRKGSAPARTWTSAVNGSSSRGGSMSSRSKSLSRPAFPRSSSNLGPGSIKRSYAPTLSSVLKEKGVRTKIPLLVRSNTDLDRSNISGSTTNLDYLATPNTLRSRTSSTTSLSSNHSTSKIPILRPKKISTPVLTESKTPTRTRTHSGSSSGGGISGLSRTMSGASDTPTGVTRKSGIVEPRRL